MPKKNPRGRQAPLSASQNFLTSSRTIQKLLAQTDIGPGDLVYEIGPGKGHITRELLRAGAMVRAIELDPKLFQKLKERFADQPLLSLRQGDFLATPLPNSGDYRVFSNIPFARTTDILRKLTSAPNPPHTAWLVMEEGAARRFCSAFDSVDGSMLSVSLRPFFDLRIIERLQRTQFHPAPYVDCVMLRIRRRDTPDLRYCQRAAFRRFLEKTWPNSPQELLTKRQISASFRQAGLPQPAPDGKLLYVQWLCLFRTYQALTGPRRRKRLRP